MSFENAVVDLADDFRRHALQEHVGGLRGRYRVSIVRYRPRRSDRQNRYYWPSFVEPFMYWLRENWGEDTLEADDAHEFLKARFLVREYVDPETGEVFTRVGSTGALTTAAFNAYLDRVADFLAEYCQIIVPPPSRYHEKDSPP